MNVNLDKAFSRDRESSADSDLRRADHNLRLLEGRLHNNLRLRLINWLLLYHYLRLLVYWLLLHYNLRLLMHNCDTSTRQVSESRLHVNSSSWKATILQFNPLLNWSS